MFRPYCLILILWLSVWAQAAPSVVDSNAACANGFTASTTVNTNSGSNLLLLVGVGTRSAATVSGVTIDSEAMTSISNNENTNGTTRLHTWKRTTTDGLNAGAGLTVTATISAENDVCVSAVVLQDVHQTTPYDGESLYDPEASGLDSTLDVTSATGDFVVDFLLLGASSDVDTETVTPGGGQTAIEDVNVLDDIRLITSTEAGAATVTMSWSWTNFLNRIQIGYNINAAAAAGSAVPMLFSRRRQ